MNQLHQKVKWAVVEMRIKSISGMRYPIADTAEPQKHYIEFSTMKKSRTTDNRLSNIREA
jgi:hypothetical protein